MKKSKVLISFILLGSLWIMLVFSVFAATKSESKGETATAAASSAAGSMTYGGHSTFNEFMRANAPSLTAKKTASGVKVVANIGSTVVLVNKNRNLPASYVPGDLVIPDVAFAFQGDNPKKQLRQIAATALEKLFAGAQKEGLTLKAVSGYRSYATQKAIFSGNAKRKGAVEANKTSARPGQSEHQTGLAIDVSGPGVGYALEESFGDTKEGKWLQEHAAEYGFIIRYQKGMEKWTGYSYEPWHIRYVGVYIAGRIAGADLTLEEFMSRFE